MPCSWHHFPGPYGMGSCVYVYDGVLIRERRSHLEEFLIFAYNYRPFIIRGHVRTGRGHFPLCMAQLLFQVINFSLHGLVAVLSLGYVTSHSRMASARLGSLHTALSISFILLILFMLRVRKIILSLGSCGLCLLRTCLVWT